MFSEKNPNFSEKKLSKNNFTNPEYKTPELLTRE